MKKLVFARSKILMQVKRLANLGNAGARYNLGNAYSKGMGVKVDKIESFNWYKRSAEKGFALALLTRFFHLCGTRELLNREFLTHNMCWEY